MTTTTATFRQRLKTNGFVLLPGILRAKVLDLRRAVDAAVVEMASDLGVTQERYLEAVSAWGKRAEVVQRLSTLTVNDLRPWAQALGAVDDAPADASLFVKSQRANAETHAHQDIAYRWNQATRYTLTTWVALDDADASTGALSFLPGSHLSDLVERQDFLLNDFPDRRDTAEWKQRGVTPVVTAGDVIVFDARTWHAAHPFTGSGARRALAVRWSDPSLSAALSIPSPRIDPERFGMDTSGRLIISAIAPLLGEPVAPNDGSLLAAVDSLRARKDALETVLTSEVWEIIERLRLALRAGDAHHGRPYSKGIWEPVRDVALPALRSAAAQTTTGDTK